ncbi:hypothetical protein Tco_1245202 [Tanacetum coccineum]
MHVVPLPMTRNYMPPGPDREIDESQFTYGPKQSKTSESNTNTSDFNSCESNSSVETLESVPEPVVNEKLKLNVLFYSQLPHLIKSLIPNITQEASGSLEDLEIIQEEDTHLSLDTSLNHEEDDQEINEPQSDINPIHKSTRTLRAPDRMCLHVDAKEHELHEIAMHYVIHINQVKKIDQGLGSTSGIRACALRNFDLEVMEFENTQNNSLAKLPMLKLGEYETWEIRIKQYFQIKDYALWEVIENGNSWVPIPVTTPPETGTSTTTKMTLPATIKEKKCKKNDVKARSILLMALPNEHQLTFD